MPATILQFPTARPVKEDDDREKRSHLVALASQYCSHCAGTSIRDNGSTCLCAYRAVCRGVIRRWREDHHRKLCTRNNRRGWDMPSVEFCIDVIGVARKALDARLFAVWESAVLHKLQWKAVTARLGLAKGEYFRALYLAEARLGRAFIEALPYELYPVENYYTIFRKEGVKANTPERVPAKVIPFRQRPVLAMAA